jgi:uncharacterized protein YbjT (DUF2867 family)
MKIVVIGGTGLIGSKTVAILRPRRRWSMRPWVRRSAGDKHERGEHLTPR